MLSPASPSWLCPYAKGVGGGENHRIHISPFSPDVLLPSSGQYCNRSPTHNIKDGQSRAKFLLTQFLSSTAIGESTPEVESGLLGSMSPGEMVIARANLAARALR